MLYDSRLTMVFSMRYSTQKRRVPSFLGPNTIGAVYSVFAGFMMFSARNLSISALSNSRVLGPSRYSAACFVLCLVGADLQIDAVLCNADVAKVAIPRRLKFRQFGDEWFLVSMTLRGYGKIFAQILLQLSGGVQFSAYSFVNLRLSICARFVIYGSK